jgi:hypothetical protein
MTDEARPSTEIYAADPTVEIWAEIFTELPGGELGRWEWREAPHIVPRIRARVTSEGELACELAFHGPRVASRLESISAPDFRLTAHCLTTHEHVGEWQWERSTETSHWLPVERPWCVWNDLLRLDAIARKKRAQYEQSRQNPRPGEVT